MCSFLAISTTHIAMTMPKRNKNLRIRDPNFFLGEKSSKSAPNFPLCCVQIPFRYGFLFHPHSYIAVFTIDFKRKIGGNKDKNLCHCCLRSRFTIALSIVKVQYVSIGNDIHLKYIFNNKDLARMYSSN